MSLFPSGWALQKPQQTIEPADFRRMWQNKELIGTFKRDGNRAHIVTANENTRIYSRNGTLDWTEKLPEIRRHFEDAPAGWLFDVELHTLEEGTSSFQEAMNNEPDKIFASPFDMLRIDGSDAKDGYEDRYERVKEFMSVFNTMPITRLGVEYDLSHIVDYEGVLREIEKRGNEGFVFWHRRGPHVLNLNGNTKRGKAWKVKIRQTEDLLVVGWNPNKGDQALGVGSLKLARPNGKVNKSAGKVGSFDKSFDRHAAMTMATPYIVEVSHYGLDENGNMTFPKVERYRNDLAADYGLKMTG